MYVLILDAFCFQTETLIKALEDLENSASSDAAVRERIAALPPEVSDAGLLGKLAGRKEINRIIHSGNLFKQRRKNKHWCCTSIEPHGHAFGLRWGVGWSGAVHGDDNDDYNNSSVSQVFFAARRPKNIVDNSTKKEKD